MANFGINGLRYTLPRTTKLNGVTKGIGTTIRINGYQVNNIAPGPDLVPVTICPRGAGDASSACFEGFRFGTLTIYYDEATTTFYNDALGLGLFNGGDLYYVTDTNFTLAPFGVVRIDSSGNQYGSIDNCSLFFGP